MFHWQCQTYLLLKTIDFAEMETHFPVKHRALQNGRFQIHPEVRGSQLKDTISSLVLSNKDKLYRSLLQSKQICLVLRLLRMTTRTSLISAKPSTSSSMIFSRPWNLGVNQTRIPRLPSLPCSGLVSIKHTYRDPLPCDSYNFVNRPFRYSNTEFIWSDIFIHLHML